MEFKKFMENLFGYDVIQGRKFANDTKYKLNGVQSKYAMPDEECKNTNNELPFKKPEKLFGMINNNKRPNRGRNK